MKDKHVLVEAFSRFNADYGMVFVLLVLVLFFSLMTIEPQSPTGTTAGRRLAAEIAEQSPDGKVLILAGTSPLSMQFVTALEDALRGREISVLRTATGSPSALRAALREIATSSDRPTVIACMGGVARLPFVRNRRGVLAPLAGADLMVPSSYDWPSFILLSNLQAIANRVAVIAIIAIGMTMVIITAGIDLSVGSLLALCAVVAARLIRDYAGAEEATAFGMTACCAAAIALGAGVGAFSGTMVTWFKIPAFIVTLAMMQVASGMAFILSNSQSVYQVPESIQSFGSGFILGIPTPVMLMIVLYVVAHVMMTRTTLGRHIYAVGGNPEAARLSGVPVRRVLLICYTTCGALSGLGGVIRASELKGGSPNYGALVELEAIAAVVVGGASLAGGEGKIFGTLIGALIIGVIRNGMNQMDIEPNAQRVVLGLVILAAVLLDKFKKSGWRMPRE